MRPQFPASLHLLSTVSIVVAAACALWIAFDLIRRPQKMWIMNLVWPLTALFGSILWLAAYWKWGRMERGGKSRSAPFAAQTLKGASHCGAGCTLGDIVGEFAGVLFPTILVAAGWHRLFQERTYAAWVVDFVFAFGFGIVFQYFTIAPMRNLGVRAGLIAAVKADTASITSWQVGMYGVMAIVQLAWFRARFGAVAPPTSVEFWAAMQIAMIGGFLTSYPVNWWLIRAGLKEAM